MTSTELVPLNYDRESYNAIHDTHLETHGDSLTAVEAADINDYYDISIRGLAHGKRSVELNGKPEGMQPAYYEEATKVVDGLQPGDTLFVEGYNYKKPVMYGDKEKGYIDATVGAFGAKVAGMLYPGPITPEQLEEQRNSGSINAIDYAAGLARLKGITVVHADLDAFEWANLEVLNSGKNPVLKPDQANPSIGEGFAQRVYERRVTVARNIVKDWALQHLPDDEFGELPDRKPKLVLMFGGMHLKELESAFKESNLEVDAAMMDTTELRRQMVKHYVGLTANNAIKFALEYEEPQAKTLPDSPSSAFSTLTAKSPRLSKKAIGSKLTQKS